MNAPRPIRVEDVAWALLVGLAAGAFIALCALGGCSTLPPTRPEYVSAGLKIAGCVDNVLREEQARRDAIEAANRELVERKLSEPSTTTAEEVEKVLR